MKTLIEMTAEAFLPNGPLEMALKEKGRSYIASPVQMQYANMVANALTGESSVPGMVGLDRGMVTLLQGETGVGKGLGYLVPMCLLLAVTKRRGLISTFTLALQNQIINREFEIAARVAKIMTGEDLSVAVQKGRRNFVSPARIDKMIKEMSAGGQLKKETKEILESLAIFPSGDISEWQEDNDLPDGISTSDICLLPGSKLNIDSAYIAHREKAKEADIVVVNHAILMISCFNWHATIGKTVDDTPPFDAAIIDEADKIPISAESVFSRRVSVPMVENIAESLRDYGISGLSVVTSIWRDWMDQKFTELTETYSSSFRREGEGGYIVLGDDRTMALKNKAREMAEMVSAELKKSASLAEKSTSSAGDTIQEEDVSELSELAKELQDFVDCCNGGNSKNQTPVIRWSPVKTFGAFTVVPIWPGRLVTRLWDENKKFVPYMRTTIMTSATLDAPGDTKAQFVGFRDQIGVSTKWGKYNERGSGSVAPEKFGKMKFVLADRVVPKPTVDDSHGEESDPVWIEYAAIGVSQAQKRGGRSLVLLTSFKDVEEISTKARAMGVSLIEHKRGEKLTDYLKLFIDPENENGTLITPSGWEGTDLPGLLRHIIIPRVPFTVVDNVKNKATLDRMTINGYPEASAKGVLFNRSLSDTMRKLTQGMGRGIRSPNDDVIVWVLDPRFPLPDSITSNRRLRQSNLPAPMYKRLSSCIPVRFRSGIDAAYDEAEILPYRT